MASYVWAWYGLRPKVIQSGGSGMERPGVYPVEVATVLNMRTVTGGGQVVLEDSRRAGLVRIYILLDMTSWLVMERDSVGRREDGPENNESAQRKI